MFLTHHRFQSDMMNVNKTLHIAPLIKIKGQELLQLAADSLMNPDLTICFYNSKGLNWTVETYSVHSETECN